MSTAQATMSAVEKVAANAAFSSSSSIGQSNRKSSHLLSCVTTNPESDLSRNSSDGNSEFEEALKNIKALNGQSRYSDNNETEEKASSVEKSSAEENVFDMKLKPDESNISDSLSSNSNKKSESQLNSESVAKLKSNLGSFFSKTYSDNIVDQKPKIFCEDAESDSNEVSCDKADLVKNKKDSDKSKSIHLNHQGNGDNGKTESRINNLDSETKIRDSFKTFLQKSSDSYSKMLLKKKEDTNVQSVTSTGDSQSSSKFNKTSSVRGNLFENFESIASPEKEEKEDEKENSGQKEESIDCKSNGQAESKLSSSLNNEKKPSENQTATINSLKEESETKLVNNNNNNTCDKKDSVFSNHTSQLDNLKSNSKSSPLHLKESPQLSPVSAKESEGNSIKSSKEILDNCRSSDRVENNISKKRAANSGEDANDTDCNEEDIAPVKRSRLDDMIGNLGSRIGIKLDSIPFEDELEESSKDSDSSEKQSEDTASTDDEDDGEKPTHIDKKIISMTEKELAEIVKREVEKILNNTETNLLNLQQKIEELQVANENLKSRAKELQKQLLEQTVLQQKSEKRKANATPKSTRHVGIQVDEGKILPSTNQPRSGPISSQLNTTPVSKFQSPTVKSLLDASRSTNLNQVSSSPTVVYQSSPGLFVVSSPTAASTTATTSTAHSILTKPVSSHISTPQAASRSSGSVKVIDLTGDDENSLSNQSNGKNLVHAAAAIAPIGQVRPGIVSQQVVHQVTPVQQQPVPPGTSFLLSTPAGTQIISPTVTQGIAGTRPGVCQYVLTSTPNIRPGSLVTVVPTQGTQNSSIRPPIVSSTIASASSLPQLRPALPSSSVASVDLTKGIRPPPPLQSAPMPQRVVSTILSSSSSSTSSSSPSVTSVAKHPAPLPPTPSHNVQAQGLKSTPPKPGLRITRVAQGIVLSWNMTLADTHAEISNYQLYAYQEGSASPSTSLWKKVGDIKALPLPMACTLTQFHEGNKYHFAVRAVDTHGRVGPFSDPNTINLSVGGK